MRMLLIKSGARQTVCVGGCSCALGLHRCSRGVLSSWGILIIHIDTGTMVQQESDFSKSEHTDTHTHMIQKSFESKLR